MPLVRELPVRPDPGSPGEIWKYVRPNGRCPADDFLREEIERSMRKKFDGSFGAIVRMGAEYESYVRFRALSGAGKPLWEFKEHDHRLYCFRQQLDRTRVLIVLLNGWVKDKDGKANEEVRRIETAQSLCREYLQETRGG